MRIHQYGNAPRDNNLKKTLFIMFIVNQLNLMERKTSLITHYFEIFLVDTTDGNGYSSKVEDQLAVTVYADDVAFTSLEEAREDTQPYMVLGKTLKRFTQKGDFLGMGAHHLHERLHDAVGDAGWRMLAPIVDQMILRKIVAKELYEVTYCALKEYQSTHGRFVLLAHSSPVSFGLITEGTMNEAGMSLPGIGESAVDQFDILLEGMCPHIVDIQITPGRGVIGCRKNGSGGTRIGFA